MITLPALVYSDLDGTLLDHYSYDYSPATNALAQLKGLRVPVILNTSKTFAEVKTIAEQLALDSPLIVENGAAIYCPATLAESLNIAEQSAATGYTRKTFTQPHQHWLSILNRLQHTFGDEMTSFSQLGIEGIVEYTGLSTTQAQQASQREFGEPVVWRGSDARKVEFMQELRALGADPIEGGRFIHVCGQCSKGHALKWLTDCYQQALYPDQTVSTVALGDGKNDIAMLNVADIAVRILSPVHQPPGLSRSGPTITTTEFGPTGWAEAITTIFSLS